jgi:hypothetical protein
MFSRVSPAGTSNGAVGWISCSLLKSAIWVGCTSNRKLPFPICVTKSHSSRARPPITMRKLTTNPLSILTTLNRSRKMRVMCSRAICSSGGLKSAVTPSTSHSSGILSQPLRGCPSALSSRSSQQSVRACCGEKPEWKESANLGSSSPGSIFKPVTTALSKVSASLKVMAAADSLASS